MFPLQQPSNSEVFQVTHVSTSSSSTTSSSVEGNETKPHGHECSNSNCDFQRLARTIKFYLDFILMDTNDILHNLPEVNGIEYSWLIKILIFQKIVKASLK